MTFVNRWSRIGLVGLATLLSSPTASGGAAAEDVDPLVADAETTLQRGIAFFQEQLAVEGSYVWKYSEDLSFRSGEAVTDENQGWAQPPGTPAIGLAFMQAFEATGRERYLDAASQAARALARTQLTSGGWNALLEFDPAARKSWCYRIEIKRCNEKGGRADNDERDAATLDDDTTQSALRLLMLVDRALNGGDELIQGAVRYGLTKMIELQYPNGAWTIRIDRRVPNPEILAAPFARYPETWSRQHTKMEHSEFYATNDDIQRDAIHTMLLAHRLYDDPDYLAAAIRGGYFHLAAQMPTPQPGWAQIYNRDLEPVWGRRFEPPAIASRETAGAITALLDLYLYTGDERFTAAAAPAVDWLKGVALEEGRWSRFYELETERPLYVNEEYEITYDADDMPSHYGFIGDFGIPAVLEQWRQISETGRKAYLGGLTSNAEDLAIEAEDLRADVTTIVKAQDELGRWIEEGFILSATFAANTAVLAHFIAATEGRQLQRDALFP